MNREDILKNLALCFFRKSFTLPLELNEVLDWEDQERLLQLTVKHPSVLKYPIDKRYTKHFLKNILKVLAGHTEVHDDIYKILCDVMEDTEENDCLCYQHYVVDKNFNEIITMKETNRLIIHGTTGLRTWEAGLILADWCLSNKHQFLNKNVLELGCGAGFTGIIIAKFCTPSIMYLTDYHNEVLKLVSENIFLNFPTAQKLHSEDSDHVKVKTENSILGLMKLDWNSFRGLSSFIPDIVLGADIVYDPSTILPLCNTLHNLLLLNSLLKVFIAGVVRNKNTFNYFLECLEERHISVKMLDYRLPQYIEWDTNADKYLIKIFKKHD